MRDGAAAWQGIRALCVTLVLALSLTVSPAIEAAKHGPGTLVAEAAHMAHHAGPGHDHAHSAAKHDSADHDHVTTAILPHPAPEVFPAPARHLPPGAIHADDRTREGPRRPPRLVA